MRFVIDTDQHAWLDPYLKAPGRGAHLCYSKSCVERAWKKKSLSASFKTAVSLPTPTEFTEVFIESQLKKIANLIGLARRRGEIISGLNILERPSSPVFFLIFASDIAEQSKSNLRERLCRNGLARYAEAPFLPDGNEKASVIFNNKVLLSQTDRLKDRWSSSALGSLISKAHRVALGITSKEIADELSLEIMRISQVLVASSP